MCVSRMNNDIICIFDCVSRQMVVCIHHEMEERKRKTGREEERNREGEEGGECANEGNIILNLCKIIAKHQTYECISLWLRSERPNEKSIDT